MGGRRLTGDSCKECTSCAKDADSSHCLRRPIGSGLAVSMMSTTQLKLKLQTYCTWHKHGQDATAAAQIMQEGASAETKMGAVPAEKC